MVNLSTQVKIKLYIAFAIVAFAIVGFLPNSAIDIRACKRIIAELGIILIFSLFFVKNIWLGLFMAWTTIRVLIGIYELTDELAVVRMQHYAFSKACLQTTFLYVVAYQAFINSCKREYISRMFNAICILTLIQCAWIIMQQFGLWVFIKPKVGLNVKHVLCNGWIVVADAVNIKGKLGDSFTGLMSNVNMTSSMLVLGLPCFFRKKWAYCIPIIVASLLLARSLGGLVPMCIILSIMAYLWVRTLIKPMRWKVGFAIFVVCGIAVGVYGFYFENMNAVLTFSGRLDYWTNSIKSTVLHRHMFIGWGIGQFKVIYPAVVEQLGLDPQRILYLHNDYLQLFIENGLIGLILSLLFIISVILKGFMINTKITFICTLGIIVGMLNCSVNFLMHTTVGLMLMVYLAIIEIETRRTAEEADNYYF